MTTTDFPAREHYLDLPAGRYRYLSWGDPQAPTVALLHGRTSLVETWEDVAQRLAAGYHVVALEQRGHGGSPWDPEARYDLADFLADYEAFADAVIPQRHILMGHSMGSCTSLVYAGRHPDRLHAVVLEDGGPPGPTVTQAVSEDLEGAPRSFPSWQAAYEHIAATHPHLHGEALRARVDRTVRPGEGGRYWWRSDHHGLLAPGHFADELMEHGQWRAVDELAVPALFIWASRPPCLVEPEIIDEMVRRNPLITKATVDSGHSVHEETLSGFLAAAEPFVRHHTPAAVQAGPRA